MGAIQSSFNQGLSISALLFTQSPISKTMKAGRDAKDATNVLKDIQKNFEKIEKGEKEPYSETEKANIKGKIDELNRTIQDAKVLEVNHPLLTSKTIPQKELSPLLENIEKYMSGGKTTPKTTPPEVVRAQKANASAETSLELERNRIKNSRLSDRMKSHEKRMEQHQKRMEQLDTNLKNINGKEEK